MDPLTPHDRPDHDPVTHWQPLVDCRLIGRCTGTSPDIALARERNEAIARADASRTRGA